MNPDGSAPPQYSSTPKPHIVEVAAGLIFREGRLLITKRHADAHLGGLWEFPGGKRKPDETFQHCLVRELMEELGVQVRVGELFDQVTHDYPEKTVNLKFFVCAIDGGDPAALDCAAFKWISETDLGKHEFPPADERLLKKLSGSELWRRSQTGMSL